MADTRVHSLHRITLAPPPTQTNQTTETMVYTTHIYTHVHVYNICNTMSMNCNKIKTPSHLLQSRGSTECKMRGRLSDENGCTDSFYTHVLPWVFTGVLIRLCQCRVGDRQLVKIVTAPRKLIIIKVGGSYTP